MDGHHVLCAGRPWLLELDLFCRSYCGTYPKGIISLLASRDSNLRLSRHGRTEGCEPQK